MVGVAPFGCGQCLPCRINRRRIWSWRMYLESLSHNSSSFITLTYAPEFEPPGSSLDPKHVQLWLKRLRFSLERPGVRFFLCGEYGDVTERPHYHACLFGVGFDDWSTVATSWGKGFVHTAEFNETTAQYVCGYVTKKMTSKDDSRLNGRHPEFARMSNRPGIGALSMATVSDHLHSVFGLDQVAAEGDVPRALKLGRRSIPLGRYLRSVLRKEMGFTDDMVEKIRSRFFSEKALEALLRVSSYSSFYEKFPGGHKDALVSENQGLIWSLEGKSRLHNRRFL